jgi:hypothetical protein
MENRFIIFALARTGSSTLAKALNLHHDLSCFHEPFNPGNEHSSYQKNIHDECHLSAEISKIQSKYKGIKHVWHPQGWPFPKNPSLNKLILLKFNKVILLNRRSILQRVVSNQISLQTNIWGTVHPGYKEKIAGFMFDPLDKNWIRWHIQNEIQYLNEWKCFLRNKSIDFLEVHYEDIFPSDNEQKIKIMNDICSFLGGSKFEEKNKSILLDLLSPEHKMSPVAIYNKIPNIIEIEMEFGNDISGWLFK